MNAFQLRLYAKLFVAISVISFAGILIKWTPAPAMAIAALRLCMATLILSPWVLTRSRPQLRALTQYWPMVFLSGAALAIHFGSWIWSLKFTSVASSVVLVTTTPLFVGLGSYLFLKEKPTRPLMIGIVVSVVGGVLIGYGDFQISGQALLGDGLALVGALSASAYFLIGRRLRAHTELGAYIYWVYGIAAILLLMTALLMGVPLFVYEWETYGLILLLALGPQLIGHSTLNWSLKYLSAGAVAVAQLGEPIGAALLAYWLLGEPITVMTLLGGGLILLGVYAALRAESITQKSAKK
jgi:drug/metabolite transporter (DMT)-like permease